MSGALAVSVLLPVRDAEKTIEKAVRDVLAQTVEALELIVVDDGSTDGTAQRLREISDPRLKLLRTEPRGVVQAANLALSHATAPFIARMDGDDECSPQRLEVSIKALLEDPSLAGVGTQVEIFRDDMPVSPNLQAHQRWLNSLTTPEKVFADRFVESPLCNPSLVLQREAFDWAGGWVDGDFPEDWELLLRLLESGRRLRCLEPVLVRWRDHDRRVTRQDPRYGLDRHLQLKARFLRPLLRRPLTMWGAGKVGLELSRLLGGVDRFLEVNPRKIGMAIDGTPVVAHTEVGGPNGFLVAAVGAKGARENIRAYLNERNWVEGRDYVCAA